MVTNNMGEIKMESENIMVEEVVPCQPKFVDLINLGKLGGTRKQMVYISGRSASNYNLQDVIDKWTDINGDIVIGW